MNLTQRINNFFKKSPLIKIIGICGVLIGIGAGLKSLFTSNITIIKNNTNRPYIKILEPPKIDSMRLKMDISEFPERFRKVTTTKQSYLVEKKSIVFIKDSIPTYDTIIIHQPDKINLDSIYSNKINSGTLEAIPSFNFSLKIQNIGKSTAQILFVGMSDTLSIKPFLRNYYYSDQTYNKEIIHYFYEFELKDLLPDSIITISMIDGSNGFQADSISRNCIVHFLIIYKDADDNYYDSYYWVKYKLFDPPVYIIKEPKYAELKNGDIILTTVIFHYLPTKPSIKDYIQFVNNEYNYDYTLTNEEKNNLINRFYK